MNITVRANTATELPYLPHMSLAEFLSTCEGEHPRLYDCIDRDELEANGADHFAALDSIPAHFESKEQGGRGDDYREAQLQHPLARVRGIKALFDLVRERVGELSPETIVLDAIGGNGSLTRAMRLISEPEGMPTVITSDPSPAMIRNALQQSLPAIRQAAQRMFLKGDVIDGLIYAYGTHHLPPSERPAALREAFRVLKPGGCVVLQDFEEGSPTARWYSELLDRYTMTGHPFQHFTRSDMVMLLEDAGFEDIVLYDIYDPFELPGSTPEHARHTMLLHMSSLFALEKLLVPESERNEDFWEMLGRTFEPYGSFDADSLAADTHAESTPCVLNDGEQYNACFPRFALVAVGSKPR